MTTYAMIISRPYWTVIFFPECTKFIFCCVGLYVWLFVDSLVDSTIATSSDGDPYVCLVGHRAHCMYVLLSYCYRFICDHCSCCSLFCMFCRSLSLSRHRRNIQHVIICCRRRSRRLSMYDGIYACTYVCMYVQMFGWV